MGVQYYVWSMKRLTSKRRINETSIGRGNLALYTELIGR